IEVLISDAHPEYDGSDDIDLIEGTAEPEPPKDIPSAADITIPVMGMVTQEYVQKAVLFFLILAVVLYVVRRRTSSRDSKIDEKSMA
ncbi:uncharacterized protein A1O9_11902, partial [Exophiala aquamarina CBS 119918]